jgi:hypothetical protein
MADFKLGRLKFKWRGDWAGTTGYVIDDIVKYGGNAYVCIKNHTSPASETDFYTTPATYTTNWQLHQESFYFKGAYANATWYKLNDLVSYGGKQYRTTTQHTSSSLVLDQSKFEQFSDGILFKGEYASSTQYKLNDLIKYGGRTYRCTTEHTSASGGDINIVLGNFTIYSEGLAFKGDFTVSTYYKLDDVVKFGAYQYKCIIAHTSGGTLSDFEQENFTVYSEGLQFEDSYNAATLYQKGDVVTYGGYSYAYVQADEATGQTPGTPAVQESTGGDITTSTAHGRTVGNLIEVRDITVSCDSGNKTYPIHSTNTAFTVEATNLSATEFQIELGTSTVAQSYVSGGTVLKSNNTRLAISGFNYNIATGKVVITVPTHGLSASDTVNIFGVQTTCAYGTKVYPQAPFSGIYPVKTQNGDKKLSVFLAPSNIDHRYVSGGTVKLATTTNVGSSTALTNFSYDNATGLITITSATHGLSRNEYVKLDGIIVECSTGQKTYPNSTISSGIFKVYDVPDSSTYIVATDKSAIAHTYVSGGTSQKITYTTSQDKNISNFIYNRSNKVYWDVVTTGFKAVGVYTHGTLYKTGDTVQYGGNSYVCVLDAQSQRPAQATGATNTTYWSLVVEGFKWIGAYSTSTTYNIGETVRYLSNSYVNLKDQVLNIEPGTDGTVWQGLALGDSGAVLQTRGDMITQDNSGTARLALGLPGAVLTNDGSDILWAGISGKNILWVSPSGVDGSAGTESMPYKTLAYAAKHAKKSSIREIKDISGGVGGTQDNYDNVRGYSSKEFEVSQYNLTASTFEIQMGTSTLAHTYISGGTVRKADDSTLTITNAPYTHGSGVITIHTSAAHGLLATNKVRLWGLNYTCANGAKTYPEIGGPSLYRVNTKSGSPVVDIVNGSANHIIDECVRIDGTSIGFTGPTGGDITTAIPHARSVGDLIEVRDLLVNCPSGNKTYPIISTTTAFAVEAAGLTTTSFQVDIGTSSTAQTYVAGTGEIVKADNTRLAVTGFVYNISTGKAVITTATHSLSASDTVNIFGIKSTCEFGTKVYPQAPYSGIYPVVSTSSTTKLNFFLPPSNINHTYVSGGTVRLATTSNVGSSKAISNVVYDNLTGLITVTSTLHGLANNDLVKVENILLSCTQGSKTYPDTTFSSGVFKVYNVVDANTYIFGTDKSGFVHTYVSGGTSQKVTVATSEQKSVDSFTYKRIGGSNTLNFKVKSVAGDIIRLKNGTFKENLPMRIREGVSIVGESLRNTRVTPNTGTGSQIATVEVLNNVSGATDGMYKYIHQDRAEKPFTVASVVSADSFTIDIGTDTRSHTYVDGGLVVNAAFGKFNVTDAPYVHSTGIITITTSSNHGLSATDPIKLSGLKYHCDDGEKVYPETGDASVWNIVVSGGAATQIITYHGGINFAVNDIITLKSADIGNGGDLTLKVKKLEQNTASNFFLTNEKNNIRNMTFFGLDDTKVSGGLYQATVVDGTNFKVQMGSSVYVHTYISGGHIIKVGSEATTLGLSNILYNNSDGMVTVTTTNSHGLTTGDWITLGKMKFTCDLGEKIYPSGPMQQAVMSLDPIGNIYLTSPYIQNCTSINKGACGVQVDGNLHLRPFPRSYKSMLANDFTQINEDGIGIHILGYGRVEAVSVFVYYCEKAVYAESGGFIRALNCSHAYGEKAVVASGANEEETPIGLKTRGMMLQYDKDTFGGTATTADIENSITSQGQGTATIVGSTSGATATLFRYNVSLLYLHIDNITGNFAQGETITITKEDSSTFTVDLDSYFGGQSGSTGADIVTSTNHGRASGDLIEVADVVVSCPSGNKTYPVSSTTTAFTVEATNLTATDFQVNLGTSSIAQTYVNGGTLVKSGGTRLAISNFVYNIATGKAVITTAAHGLSASDTVNLFGITTSCSFGTKVYPQVPNSGIYPVKSSSAVNKLNFFLPPSEVAHTYVSGGTIKSATPTNVGTAKEISNAAYDNVTGLITITSASHGLIVNDLVKLQGLQFTCSTGSKAYPDDILSSGIFKVYDVVDSNTYIFGTAKSAIAHTYVIGGTSQKVTVATSSTHNISGFVYNRTAAAQQGQRGPLLAVKTGTTNLNAVGLIKLASNVKFPNDNTFYRVGLVSEEDTTNETAVIRLTQSIGLSKAKNEDTVNNITDLFSQIRLTGHDFLNIGTGDFTTTNYPLEPTQAADQADEVTEVNGGRVYWVSTDQQGDFRVGDLFKIEQATGSATLNADAFNLSGLSELKLGSIGAELGAAINEFSTDATLGGNSNTAIPTENAVVGYMTRDKAGTGAWVPPTGTSAQRPVGGQLYSGALRYNSSIVAWEGYNGTSWTGLAGGTPWTTLTGDGSTVPVAIAGQRILVDTSLFAMTIKLPVSPLVGDSIVWLDVNGSFQANNLTIDRNGHDIMNLQQDMIADINHAGFTLVYTGVTNGWKLVEVA